MLLSLAVLSARFPELNKKVYGEEDFHRVCAEENIFTAEALLPEGIDGIYIVHDNSPMIVIDTGLSYYKKLETCFHELGIILCTLPTINLLI